MENKERKRAHFHRMQERELKDVHQLIEKEKHLKKGGHYKLSGSFMKRGAPRGNIDGGSLTNLHIPREMGFGKSLKSPHLHIEKGQKMKRGGHHRHHEYYDHGGHAEPKMYRHGGHHTAHHHDGHPPRHHHMMHRNMGGHYSHGGSMYEHEMVGEHPTHSFHHYDYEGMMRGEHPMHRAEHMSHHHPETQVYRHGGHMQGYYSHGGHHRHHEHGGHTRKKYAAGGAGKIRHNEMTASGKPIHRHHHDAACKVKVY